MTLKDIEAIEDFRQSIGKTLISREQIARRVQVLGDLITEDFLQWQSLLVLPEDVADKPICPSLEIITLLTGSILFTADLVRNIPLPLHIHPLKVHSYQGSERQQNLTWHLGPDQLPIFTQHHYILIVDDILDSGQTLLGVINALKLRESGTSPLCIRSCVLLDKKLSPVPEARQALANADFCGFEIPDEFVVGYGMDFNGKYRNIPDIATIQHAIK